MREFEIKLNQLDLYEIIEFIDSNRDKLTWRDLLFSLELLKGYILQSEYKPSLYEHGSIEKIRSVIKYLLRVANISPIKPTVEPLEYAIKYVDQAMVEMLLKFVREEDLDLDALCSKAEGNHMSKLAAAIRNKEVKFGVYLSSSPKTIIIGTKSKEIYLRHNIKPYYSCIASPQVTEEGFKAIIENILEESIRSKLKDQLSANSNLPFIDRVGLIQKALPLFSSLNKPLSILWCFDQIMDLYWGKAICGMEQFYRQQTTNKEIIPFNFVMIPISNFNIAVSYAVSSVCLANNLLISGFCRSQDVEFVFTRAKEIAVDSRSKPSIKAVMCDALIYFQTKIDQLCRHQSHYLASRSQCYKEDLETLLYHAQVYAAFENQKQTIIDISWECFNLLCKSAKLLNQSAQGEVFVKTKI